jgi:hypothetical protein
MHVRVINAATGQLIRELTLDPDKRYQATGKPSGWPKTTPRPRWLYPSGRAGLVAHSWLFCCGGCSTRRMDMECAAQQDRYVMSFGEMPVRR